MDILLNLLKEIALFFIIIYLLIKTQAFKLILTKDFKFIDYLTLYFFFSIMSIIGTYCGIPVNGAIANNRVIGAAIAGLIGGPTLGFSVGVTAGIHRYTLGGFSAVSCGLSTTLEGLLAGLVHQYFFLKGKYNRVFDPDVAFITVFISELLHMIILILLSRPIDEAISLVRIIALPMIISNSLGAALMINLIKDRRLNYDKIGSIYSKQALRIAQRIIGELSKDLNKKSAEKIAQIITEETKVSAVEITDREKILAFKGIGDDHHKPELPISSDLTKESINENKIIFLDGKINHYICPYTDNCKLTSVLIVPLRVKDDVIGTIKLYEQKNKSFFKINETLGKGIAELVANQLLAIRYEHQKNLLTKAELNLLQAKVNPHFLFNAINTIIAISRQNPDKSRKLLLHLSNYFRKNLNRNEDLSSLKEELFYVNSYLELERARFQDKLNIVFNIDNALLDIKVPTFTLQPLVENAIKHGISNILDDGKIEIRIFRNNGNIQIDVEDNAGIFVENKDKTGLGIKLVDRRIKNLVGNNYGVSINCEPNIKTISTVLLPCRGVN